MKNTTETTETAAPLDYLGIDWESFWENFAHAELLQIIIAVIAAAILVALIDLCTFWQACGLAVLVTGIAAALIILIP